MKLKSLLLILSLLLISQMTLAGELWSSQNQTAYRQFKDKQYNQASNNFNNPAWQAAADYKAGKYEEAEKYYQANNDYYNLGNTQAQQKKYKQAIASYEQALKQNPNNKDAQVNLDIVKKIKPPPPKKNQDKNNKDNKNQKNNKQQQNQSQQNNKQQSQPNKQQSQQQQNQQQQNQQQNKQQQNQQQNKQQQNQQQPKNAKDQQAKDAAQKPQQSQQQPQATKQGKANDDKKKIPAIPRDSSTLWQNKFKHQQQLQQQSQLRGF